MQGEMSAVPSSGANTGLGGLWSDAIDQYYAASGRSRPLDEGIKTLSSLESLTAIIEQRAKDFAVKRSRHKPLFAPLKSCLTFFTVLTGAGQSAASASPFPAAGVVLGAVANLLKACEDVTVAYDALENLLEQVATTMQRISGREIDRMDSRIQHATARILAAILVVLGTAEKMISQSRGRQFARSFFTSNDLVQDALAGLDRAITAERDLVITDTHEKVLDLKNVAESLASSVGRNGLDMKDELRQLRYADDLAKEERRSELHDAALARLLSYEHDTSNSELYRTTKLARTPGTAEWLRKDPTFEDWMQGGPPLLWITGSPGMGKTILASATIQWLRERTSQDPLPYACVAYMYFKGGVPAQQTMFQMVKAVVRQVAEEDSRFRQAVHEILARKRDLFDDPVTAWRNLLVDYYMPLGRRSSPRQPVLVVIDGLDEASVEERNLIMQSLLLIAERNGTVEASGLRVAIFCRPDVAAGTYFEGSRLFMGGLSRKLEVTALRNRKGMREYTTARIKRTAVMKTQKNRYPERYKRQMRELVESIVNRADGMFLWAKLMIDILSVRKTLDDMKKTIASTPEGLDIILYNTFQRVAALEAPDDHFAADLISFVLCIKKPLSTAELAVLLFMAHNKFYQVIESELAFRFASVLRLTGPLSEEISGSKRRGREYEQRLIANENVDAAAEVDHARSDESLDDFASDSDEILDFDAQHSDDAHSDQHEDGSSVSSHVDSDETAEIPEIWHKQTIVFGHESIREILLKQTTSDRTWGPCHAVNYNLDDFRVRLFIVLVDILQGQVSDRYTLLPLCQYARTYWLQHLSEIDFTRVPSHLRITAAQKMAAFLRNGPQAWALLYGAEAEMWDQWIYTDRYRQLVKHFLIEHREHFETETQDWVDRFKTHGLQEVLLGSIFIEAVFYWLTKTGWDDRKYLSKGESFVAFLVLWGHLEEWDGEKVRQYSRYTSISEFTTDEILTAANTYKIERTAHWYVGVGWMLLFGPGQQRQLLAKEYFEQARSLDPEGWVIHEGLGIYYTKSGKDYKLADTHFRLAKQYLPPQHPAAINIALRIARAARKLGDAQYAINTAQEAWDTDNSEETLQTVFDAYYHTGQYDAYLNKLRERSIWHMTATGINCLYEQVKYQARNDGNCPFFQQARWIALNHDRAGIVAVVNDPIRAQILELKPEQISIADMRVCHDVSRFLMRFDDRDPLSTIAPICTHVLFLIEALPKPQAAALYIQWNVSASLLTSIHLKAALSSPDPAPHLAVLTSLSTPRAFHHPMTHSLLSTSALATFHDMRGTATPVKTRDLTRPVALHALSWLGDDDPCNDQEAYLGLGKALLALQSEQHDAQMALAFALLPLWEKTRGENGREGRRDTLVPTDVSGKVRYGGGWIAMNCSGCEKGEAHRELWVCRVCREVLLCEGCREMVREGKCGYRLCGKEHETVMIWPVVEEARKVMDDVVDGHNGLLEEWIDEMERKWKT
ncbi:hypothetical protein CAC42_6010 [Sphaceloma murrayae]|uniref:Fungal STAND N-terminal Goodbye domain-containing protein n=1 Tax=Sphaceloma murrayae TaxID=2082308 RepID=A0A2K1R003_9PEZI|nr:hypothetical protein CAC42_6010 [Sphaceloma murrayae]